METKPFELHSEYEPSGDQPRAIAELIRGLQEESPHQVLLGVTGSGKTFTMANVIAAHQKPALVLAHNKTLAAQLYQELKAFFPNNAVEYFVSYYDYYQPEAYVPSTDTYIEKDSMINEAIDRLRHSATRSLLSRRDVIIVASVSCIYGIGSSESYEEMTAWAQVGDKIGRDSFLRQLIEGQYTRNDISFSRGTFRVRGDVVEVFPAHEDESALRVEFFGDEVERITVIDPLRGQVLRDTTHIRIWPASHYAIGKEKRLRALKTIREELQERLQDLRAQDLLLEAQRLEQRTLYDLEMIEVAGTCKGIENYSRHLTGRRAGEAPPTLLDYFPRDFLIFIDESHQTVPQVRAMYRGDRARKSTLVDYGFRLPSALDNRPLMFEEFQEHQHQTVYVSATPNEFELDESAGVVVEQVVRPTGLLDPEVEVRPATHQVDDVVHEVQKRIARDEKVLITTLTKRMAEDLTDYLLDVQIKARYLHSDIDTLERVALLRALRMGEFDVLVGINLLREGLDLPEVSLVAILDADKEGFLRSATGLIQTVGRAARNSSGKAILYGDRITRSMKEAIDETERRRAIQTAHNEANGITPQTIMKELRDMPAELGDVETVPGPGGKGKRKQKKSKGPHGFRTAGEIQQEIKELRDKMLEAAGALAFEEAAQFRDEARALEELLLMPEFR